MTIAGQRGEKARIAFVDQTGDMAGGAERSLALLLDHLPSSFARTVVLFSDGVYADQLRNSGFQVAIVDLPTQLLSMQRERISLGGVLPAIVAIRRIRKVLRSLDVDLVYTNSVKAHLLAGIAARSLGIPAIAHLRDILNGNARRLLRTVLRYTTVHRIAISKAVERSMQLSHTTIIVNPLNLDDYRNPPQAAGARERLGLPIETPLVGIIGRINRWKGQDVFLRAARLVADESPAHFAIVGSAIFRDEDFLGELHQLVAKLELGERVHFVPWLADPRDAFAALDVHCNASEREPFGRTTIEAAAVGVPTISFDDGGAEDAISPELARDIVPRADVVAFASAIIKYLKDPDCRAKAGAIAIAFSQRFDADLHGKNVGALLDAVLAGLEK